MEVKAQTIPMPASEKRLQEAVVLLLRLPKLQELRVTLRGIEVRRGVEEGEPTVPETILEICKGVVPDEPDLPGLLRVLDLEDLPLEPARHQLTTLVVMTEKVRAKGLFASGWFVAEGDGLDAFLAQPTGTVPAWLLGIPVHYVPEDQLPEGRLLLVGSSTRFNIDAVYGVTADIGG